MKQLEVVHIPADQMKPNLWNVNRVPEDVYSKIRESIRREGLVEPLVVRPLGDCFEILGGEHRWRICKEDLGYETLPCVVVDLDDRRAKILSINLNELKGQPVPDLLAKLVHDLSAEVSLEDLASQLPYSKGELDDLLESLKIPDGLESFLKEEAARAERERPQVVSFVVEDEALVERAIQAAKDRGGPGMSRGQALMAICRAYLGEGALEGEAGDHRPSTGRKAENR